MFAELKSLQMSLYDGRSIPKHVKTVREEIKNTRDSIVDLNNIRYSLYHMTLDYFASYESQLYTIRHSVDKKITKGKAKYVLEYLLDISISSEQIRKLAKSSDWRNLWNNAGLRNFRVPHYSVDQQQLIAFSKMYDGVYKSMDTPEEFVIQDDDMLDGWMYVQQKKREKEEAEQKMQKHVDKHPNADEVYIMTNSKEEREQVNMLNSNNAEIIKAKRKERLKKKRNNNSWRIIEVEIEIK